MTMSENCARYLLAGDKIHCYQLAFSLRHALIQPVIFIIRMIGQVKLCSQAFAIIYQYLDVYTAECVPRRERV